MQIPLVMTIIGSDRTGLVESVARTVADQGGNWLESRMCRLGGEFAGILRVEISAEKKTALLDALKQLQQHGLQIVVRADPASATLVPGQQTKLEIVGSDRPGSAWIFTRPSNLWPPWGAPCSGTKKKSSRRGCARWPSSPSTGRRSAAWKNWRRF